MLDNNGNLQTFEELKAGIESLQGLQGISEEKLSFSKLTERSADSRIADAGKTQAKN